MSAQCFPSRRDFYSEQTQSGQVVRGLKGTRLESLFSQGLLPPLETAESRRLHQIVLDIRRARAARLGLPELEEDPEPVYKPGMSMVEVILASRERWRSRNEAKQPAILVTGEGETCQAVER
jgi:hypothetical protein